jgi:hypothetical protein
MIEIASMWAALRGGSGSGSNKLVQFWIRLRNTAFAHGSYKIFSFVPFGSTFVNVKLLPLISTYQTLISINHHAFCSKRLLLINPNNYPTCCA